MTEIKNTNSSQGFRSLEKEPDPEEFFQKEDGKVAYLEQCLNCKKGCKQSFRVTNLICRSYKPK